jgi:hypothetical protein
MRSVRSRSGSRRQVSEENRAFLRSSEIRESWRRRGDWLDYWRSFHGHRLNVSKHHSGEEVLRRDPCFAGFAQHRARQGKTCKKEKECSLQVESEDID